MKNNLAMLLKLGLIIALVLLADYGAKAQSNDQPLVIKAVAPTYPPIAIAARASGSIVVEVQINAKGEVTNAHSVEGHKLLHKVAEFVARRWMFSPASEPNEKRSARLTFIFTLMQADTPYTDLLPTFMPPYKVEVKDSPGRIVQSTGH